jgi:integrase
MHRCAPSGRRLRDRAVVLLLAPLGLRAGEVANLNITDIDWKYGRIAVCGKSRRAEWLPLTQEVGDSIVAYLERTAAVSAGAWCVSVLRTSAERSPKS